MALTGNWFQRSDQLKLDRTSQEQWITDMGLVDYSLLDSIGNRSRVLRVKIVNPNNLIETSYQPMQRVRMIDDFGLVTFLGRVVSIEPDYKTQEVVVTCRDYLDDISDRTVEAASTDGRYNGVMKSRLVDMILHYETHKPSVATTGDTHGTERTLARRIGLESSTYSEYIERNYSIKGDYQSVTSSVPGDYLYRGTKTGMEAISDLANDDVQQDFIGFYYTPTPTDPSNSNHTSNPVRYPRTYWKDLTREFTNGSTYFITPQTAEDTTTPQSADIIYFGSNSQFDGLRFTYLQYGLKMAYGTYAGNLQWQYWNGTAWTGFTPTADAKFGLDSDKIYGTTYWTASDLTTWTKRDLGTTPDMPTANDATQNWAAPWATSGTTLPEDVTSNAISKVDHGDERRGTNRYWIRVYARTGSITYGYVAVTELYTKANLFHEFRCDDPKVFSEVWKYTHSTAGSGVATGREGHGGTWLSLNMTGGNAGTGSQLLWDFGDNTTNFIGGTTETWYFGSETPFNGISFHAFQDLIPDYSNVKFVWQWYSNYFGSLGEAWQTMSGLTISANTLANPTVLTTERHHLDTGDTVTITGSNSTPTINGTHIVTVISATTFSIPVNVTTAGTAGHVVCNMHISATEALSGTGDIAWKQDTGINDTSKHWYLDVRWDTEETIGTLYGTTGHDISVPEFDYIHILDDYPYKDLVSLSGQSINKESAAFGINSATAANPTVLTTSATAGGTTTNHNMQTGDQIVLLGTNTTPSLDGTHTVTSINATTVSVPINVTNAGNTGTANAVTQPPNDKYLYWVRCYITTGTPTRVATLRNIHTANVGILRYFDRGSEPWVTNNSSTVNGSIAITPVDYCYRYDTSASAGSKFTDFSQEIQSSTSDTTFSVTGNTLANPTIVTTSGPALTISGNTLASPTVITTSAVHGFSTDDSVTVTGSNSTPSINGTHLVEVLSTTTFNVPITVTTAGTAGTVRKDVAHDLTTGHSVVITSSNSTPTINGTRDVIVLSTTTFSVPVNVTTAGTAGTVVPEKVYALDNGQIGDVIYFGSDEPFTQLRLNVSDVLGSSSAGYSTVIWEYYKGETTDDWTALTHVDNTFDFKNSGINTIIFDMPVAWRTIQPGIKEANATDQSFGKTAYYVRARISANTSSPATSAAKLIQGFTGPNLWHPSLEAGTLSGVTSKRHSDPLTYGLTFTELAGRGSQRMPIVAYEIRDHALDFVNKIGVRGQAGAYGVAEDTVSITTYGIVKERIVDDSTLTNSIQCENRARALLEQLKPDISATSGIIRTIRECHIRIPTTPIYSYLNQPYVVRAGDRVNVNIPTASISNESWLVYSSMSSRQINGGSCDLVLFQDMTRVFEPGSADRRIIRDLVTRSRETANAVFQPQDKAVAGGLDWLPEGPGRFIGRDEFGEVGTSLAIEATGGGSTLDLSNEFRWTRKLYLNHKAKEQDSDLDVMRVDLLGISPSFDGDAQGGAGLTFIARDKRGGGTPDFHPGTDEATLYLRNSATTNEGSGLYLAHRDVFNSGTTYDEWGTDTPKLNAEVMTGFTGFVDHNTLGSNGEFTINLPSLDSVPLIFASICGHEGISDTPGNWTNAACNLHRWTTSGGKYTAAVMRVINYGNSLDTSGSTNGSITVISVANPTVITTTYNMPDGRSIWITGSNSTPVIDGLYYVSNKAGSSPYTYTLNSFNTSVFPVNVTSAGSAGTFFSQGHYHEFNQAQYLDYTDNAPAIGVMYMVIFNSGKNTTGLNSHFSQNHTNHG